MNEKGKRIFNIFVSIVKETFLEKGFPGGTDGKESACNAAMLQIRFNPWARKILWRRKRQPTPIFLPGESHGQRSLAGYSPWSHKESETIEVT